MNRIDDHTKNPHLRVLVAMALLTCFPFAQLRPLATFGDDNVSVTQYALGYPDHLLETMGSDDLSTRLDYLHQLIGQRMMITQARAESLHTTLDAQLAAYHIWRNLLIDQVGGRYFLDQSSRTVQVVGNRYRFEQTMIKFRVITTPDSATGIQALEALASGTPFEAIALLYDQPLHPLNKPWEKNWRYTTTLNPQVAAAAYKMNDGDVAGPLEIDSGYGIIHLIGKNYSPNHGHFDRVKRQKELSDQIGLEIDLDKVVSELRLSVASHRIRWSKRRLRKVMKGGYLTQDDPMAAATAAEPKLVTQSLFTVDKQPRTLSWIVANLSLLPPDANLSTLNVVELQDILSEMMMTELLLGLINELPDGEHWVATAERARTAAIDGILAQNMIDRIMTTAEPAEGTLVSLWGDDSSAYYVGPEVDIQEVIVDEQSQVVVIDSLLLSGTSLSTLAQRFTMREWARPRSGRLNFVPTDMYNRWSSSLEFELTEAIPGKVLGPVELDGHYLYLKIWGHRPAAWLPTDELLRRLHMRWRIDGEQAVIEGWTARQLARHYPVEIDVSLLESLSWHEEDIAPLILDDMGTDLNTDNDYLR